MKEKEINLRIPWVIIKAMLPNTRSLLLYYTKKKTHKIKLKKYFSTTWINKNIWGGAHILSSHGAMVCKRRNENSFWESCKQWILIFSISFSSSRKKKLYLYVHIHKKITMKRFFQLWNYFQFSSFIFTNEWMCMNFSGQKQNRLSK